MEKMWYVHVTYLMTFGSTPTCAVLQATPLVAGLSVAAAAFVGKQVVQTYVKLKASPGSVFSAVGNVGKQYYKV